MLKEKNIYWDFISWDIILVVYLDIIVQIPEKSLGIMSKICKSKELKKVKGKMNLGFKWNSCGHYLTAQHVSEYGNATTLRKFNGRFSQLKESTIRSFKSTIKDFKTSTYRKNKTY